MVITLDPGTTLSGTVVDAQSKPLAGVALCLGVPEEWRARFTVHSAADGSWTLPGVPLAREAEVALIDDRYVHEEREINLCCR